MPDQMPADPFSQLAAGAAQMHELYLSFCEGGFTPEQSMALLQTILASQCAVLTQYKIQNGEDQ